MLVVGTLASVRPDLFADLDVTVVKGEAEQLLWKLDEAVSRRAPSCSWGRWKTSTGCPCPTGRRSGRRVSALATISRDFPRASVDPARGCTLKCDYCPYIVLENSTRVRSPEAVADGMAQGIRRWGFRSFKFRDPLFGLHRTAVFDLAERIGQVEHRRTTQPEKRIAKPEQPEPPAANPLGHLVGHRLGTPHAGRILHTM